MTLLPRPTPSLTPSQQAAAAKIGASIERAGGVALLCGPQGVGKTTVLAAVTDGVRRRGHTVECRDLLDWLRSAAPWPGDLADVVIADAVKIVVTTATSLAVSLAIATIVGLSVVRFG
jgi:ABC-type hemin transport system ATPase subunit